MRSCTSSMNSWKWARRLRSTGLLSKKPIHQHRLAAADLAVDIKAFDRRLPAACEQPVERRRFSRPIFRDPLFQPRHFFNDGELRIVTLDAARGDIGHIAGCNLARHGGHEVLCGELVCGWGWECAT